MPDECFSDHLNAIVFYCDIIEYADVHWTAWLLLVSTDLPFSSFTMQYRQTNFSCKTFDSIDLVLWDSFCFSFYSCCWQRLCFCCFQFSNFGCKTNSHFVLFFFFLLRLMWSSIKTIYKEARLGLWRHDKHLETDHKLCLLGTLEVMIAVFKYASYL